ALASAGVAPDSTCKITGTTLWNWLSRSCAVADIAGHIGRRLLCGSVDPGVPLTSSAINLSLQDGRQFERIGKTEPIAIVRLPLLAFVSDARRDLVDVVSERPPKPNVVAEVFPFLGRRIGSVHVHSHFTLLLQMRGAAARGHALPYTGKP